MRIGCKKEIDECLLFTPGYENVLVPEVSVKDLGVLVDHKLSFKEQRDSVLRKAKNKAAWVLRTFKCRKIGIMRKLWRALVQPHLDYACLIWSPVGEIREVSRMESVLKDYTKKCKEIRNETYEVRLRKFGLMSQE